MREMTPVEIIDDLLGYVDLLDRRKKKIKEIEKLRTEKTKKLTLRESLKRKRAERRQLAELKKLNREILKNLFS